jgi:hypothetical protein
MGAGHFLFDAFSRRLILNVSPLLGILGNTLLNGSDLLRLDQAILTR